MERLGTTQEQLAARADRARELLKDQYADRLQIDRGVLELIDTLKAQLNYGFIEQVDYVKELSQLTLDTRLTLDLQVEASRAIWSIQGV